MVVESKGSKLSRSFPADTTLADVYDGVASLVTAVKGTFKVSIRVCWFLLSSHITLFCSSLELSARYVIVTLMCLDDAFEAYYYDVDGRIPLHFTSIRMMFFVPFIDSHARSCRLRLSESVFPSPQRTPREISSILFPTQARNACSMSMKLTMRPLNSSWLGLLLSLAVRYSVTTSIKFSRNIE